jgi:homogentisate 1,2-dioxygenase
MTIMVETSRTLLFTKYARETCGVFQAEGTSPQVWDRLTVRPEPTRERRGEAWLTPHLQDRFSANPRVKELLQRVKEDAAAERERIDYYHNVDLWDRSEGTQPSA